MNNLDAILEVAIGLVFVWMILSAATMEVQNIIARILQTRAKFLEEKILEMFHGDEGYVKEFYNHPAVQELYTKGFFGREKRPSYIPNAVFAEVAFEMLVNLGSGGKNNDDASVQDIINKIDAIYESNEKLGYAIRRVFPSLDGKEILSKSRSYEAKAAELKGNAEKWFDNTMTRASYWYKEKAQRTALFIGLALALFLNVDSVGVARQLWREPTLRQSLVAQAQAQETSPEPLSVSELQEEYQTINLPLGWETEPASISCSGTSLHNNELYISKNRECHKVLGLPAMNDFWGWGSKFIGLLLSAIAAMQGAPFWFDMLKKILDLGGKSSSAKEEPTPPPTQAPPQTPEAVG